MIMSFCKKGLHSFLGFTNDTTLLSPPPQPPQPPPSSTKCHALPSTSIGIGLSTATGNIPRPPNVLESATIRPPPPPIKNKDFFMDEIGGVVDGLMSCTESLGCESSGTMRMEDDEWCVTRTVSSGWREKQREASERRKERQEKTFPPPISSLNSKGQPNFILRSVRREGRLELTEVRIDRPEILRASRVDGRLRLDLLVDDENEMILEEENQEKEEKEKEVVEIERLKEEGIGGEWKISPMAGSGGEGFGRCHEVVSHHNNHHHHSHHHHHHHHNYMWRQPCVTTR